MTTLPPSIIATEEVDHEEWLLSVVNCELAQLEAKAYERAAIELPHFAKELAELTLSNQVRVKLLVDLKTEVIAHINERQGKNIHWLGGNA